MEAFIELIKTGQLTVIDGILIAIIGILLYFVTIKQKKTESYMHETISGMQVLLQEERTQTEKLSKTVYTIRQQAEAEKEKTYQLKEEILTLKQENIRLQNLVTQMDELIKKYQEEIKFLRAERGN